MVGQSALQLRRNPEAAQAYHAVIVESPPKSKRYFEGLAGLAASLEAATDREGAKRAYREIVDTQPGSGAGAVGEASARPGSRRRLRRPARRPRPKPKAKP